MKPRPKPSLERALELLVHYPSCSTWRAATVCKLPSPSSRRSATTLSSFTAVSNGSRSIPQQYQALYSALNGVKRYASPFVSLSRLELAQQGLRSIAPKTRIAVLGINVQQTARRLVRLLLADALEPEAPWEKELASVNGDQGLLLVYGRQSNPSLPPARTTIPTLQIPAGILERCNVEIIISAVSAPTLNTDRQTRPSETLLSPAVSTPTAATGRQTSISQPIHSAIVVANGLDDFLKTAELLSTVEFESPAEKNSISVALNLENNAVEAAGSTEVLDLAKAEIGLSAIRTSIAGTSTYARGWNESGMLRITHWLESLSAVDGKQQLSPAIQRLLSAVLSAAAASINRQTNITLASQVSSFSLATRTNLEASIDTFSRNAHQELQSGLASAWSSRNWKKLAWYKLFWRVDDVGLIVTDLVSNAWLPKTERATYELSGRLAQVGISPMDASPTELDKVMPAKEEVSISTQPAADVQSQLATVSDLPTEIVNTTTSRAITAEPTVPIHAPQPLSATISAVRTATISNAITSLQSTAQQLVLRTLSISGLSTGLSGLTYVSLTNSLYEAGTIAAVGVVFALYRMQGGWMTATKSLEDGLFEEGKTVIRKVVGRMRQLVETAAETKTDNVELRRLAEAKESVEKAQSELDKLVERGQSEK